VYKSESRRLRTYKSGESEAPGIQSRRVGGSGGLRHILVGESEAPEVSGGLHISIRLSTVERLRKAIYAIYETN